MRSEGYGSWVCVCVCLCVCVCPLLNISLLERLFVPKTIRLTSRAMKVRKFVRFSLKRSYGVKHERKSQYANQHWLTSITTLRVLRTRQQKLLREKQRLQRCFEDYPTMQLASVREPDSDYRWLLLIYAHACWIAAHVR